MSHSTREASELDPWSWWRKGDIGVIKPLEGKMPDTSRSETISTKQKRIAQLARQMPDKALYSISHHIDEAWLIEAYRRTRKDGAVGIDGVDRTEFETQIEERIPELVNEAKSGRYHAPAVRRVYIPKGRGETRPLGIPTLEDKVLQRAVVMALEPIYEEDFYDFSHGFRPGRSAKQAARDLREGLRRLGCGWVLDVDVKSFFDTIDHAKLQDLLRQRVTDGVIVRLVGKWLNAGVFEDGTVTQPEAGTPQGGVISPLLANIYLHEVLDAWWAQEVLPRMRGKAFLIRYADDFVIAFKREDDARRVQNVLPKRFGKYGLRLHPDKTRLVQFGPHRTNRTKGGEGRTFDFLGFTYHWGKTRKGGRTVKLKTAKARFNRAVTSLNRWCQKHRHADMRWQSYMLRAKLRGHYQYYGVPGNSQALTRLFRRVMRIWHKWLGRRSQRSYIPWPRYSTLVSNHGLLLPPTGYSRW